MRSVLEAFCFLWMVLVVVFYNVSGVFLFRTRFKEMVFVAVKIMFYILMAMVIFLLSSSEAFVEIRNVLFRTSVCLTFFLLGPPARGRVPVPFPPLGGKPKVRDADFHRRHGFMVGFLLI